jgi:acetolactate synthase I/II/III large subunit
VLPDDAIVVTDVGTPFQAAMQSLRLRGTQRLFHSGGVSAMGYGIPAAIGACLSGGVRPVVCLVGDGGAMLNIQELQTIAFNNLPIKIFVFANDGYATMRFTQETHFKREAASSPASGLGVPNFTDVAAAFGIKALYYHKQAGLKNTLRDILALRTPFLAELKMPVKHLLMPRVQSRMEDGKFVPVPIEDMWPYLPRDEFEANMRMELATSN